MSKTTVLLKLLLFTFLVIIPLNLSLTFSQSLYTNGYDKDSIFTLNNNINKCNPTLLTVCQNLSSSQKLCDNQDVNFCKRVFRNCNLTFNNTNICNSCNLIELSKCDINLNKKRLCSENSIDSCKNTYKNCGLNTDFFNLTNSCCNYTSTKNKFYIRKDPDCTINFFCDRGFTPFKDDCGCGCSNAFCTTNQTCGINKFIGQKYCINNSVYMNFTNFICNLPGTNISSCSNTTTPLLNQSCLSNQTCSNGQCMSNNINATCINNNDCLSNQICSNGICIINVNVSCVDNDDCLSNQICSHGICIEKNVTIKCSNNSACGTNGFTGNLYCSNGNVFRNFTNFTCNYPGTNSSFCSNVTTPRLNQSCLSNQTCSNGQCINNVSNVTIKCSNNSACGTNGFTGNLFCKNNSVFRNFTNFTCNNPGTNLSSCSNTTTPLLNKSCLSNQTCSNGHCNNNISSNVSQTADVSIVDFNFVPNNIIVKLGTTVIWKNNGLMNHTVTSDNSSVLNSGILLAGETYNHTFASTGTFPYHCSIHPTLMRGNVTVIP